MIDEATIEKAAGLLLQAAPAGSKVILFGSHARGDAGPDSAPSAIILRAHLITPSRPVPGPVLNRRGPLIWLTGLGTGRLGMVSAFDANPQECV